MSLSPGSLLNNGRYRILTKVGGGGMGDVYQAEDIQLNNRIVAIKEMGQQGLAQKELDQAIKLFQQEASILSSLNHPNIPDIYANFEERNHWYLVMKFIEGKTLEDYLSKAPGGQLPVKEVLQIGLQLCSALGYLHTQRPQIIFRDLKPTNVMITPQGHIYLIDFGIARFFTPGQTKDTAAFVSKGYAAPEQWGIAQTEPRSDIYSLGATLHHLLSGIHPASNTPMLWNFKPLPASIPTELSSFILQMVRIHLDERPASMAVVKQKLQSIADGRVQGANQTNTSSSTGARVTPTSQPFGPISPASTSSSLFKPSPQYQAPTPRKRSGKGPAFAVVALVICAVLGVSVALLSQTGSPKSNQHDLAYYIMLAQSGKVSVAKQPSGVGYQDNKIYFHIAVSNNDQDSHWLVVKFSFLVRDRDTRSNTVHPNYQVTFENSSPGSQYQISANSTVVENVVWGGGGFDTFSNLRDFKAELLTIDDYPIQDPQEVLNKFAVSISPVQPPLVENSNSGGSTMLCQVEITNNDTTAHIVGLTANVDYKYLDTGALQDKNYTSYTLGDYGKTISPGSTLSNFSSDDPAQKSPMLFDLVAPPDRIQSVQITFALQLMDEGDSKLPLSTTTQNIGSQCNYNK